MPEQGLEWHSSVFLLEHPQRYDAFVRVHIVDGKGGWRRTEGEIAEVQGRGENLKTPKSHLENGDCGRDGGGYEGRIRWHSAICGARGRMRDGCMMPISVGGMPLLYTGGVPRLVFQRGLPKISGASTKHRRVDGSSC